MRAGPHMTLKQLEAFYLAANLGSFALAAVIVVDGKGDDTCALFGELMVAQAAAAGLAGFVVDAASRDTDTLADGRFPIFSSGRNPCGPTKGLAGGERRETAARRNRPRRARIAVARCRPARRRLADTD